MLQQQDPCSGASFTGSATCSEGLKLDSGENQSALTTTADSYAEASTADAVLAVPAISCNLKLAAMFLNLDNNMHVKEGKV